MTDKLTANFFVIAATILILLSSLVSGFSSSPPSSSLATPKIAFAAISTSTSTSTLTMSKNSGSNNSNPHIYKIRKATYDDAETVYRFIKELARYEQLEDEVVGTVDDLRETVFGGGSNNNTNKPSRANVVLLEEQEKDKGVMNPVGFALYFYNYSTFLCKPGIYIEDLYVSETCRGKGYGKALIQYLCVLALQEGCGRVEWWCLKENKPSINFYRRLGAEEMIDWVNFRLDGNELQNVAKGRN